MEEKKQDDLEQPEEIKEFNKKNRKII